jgi:hypothetical protein
MLFSRHPPPGTSSDHRRSGKAVEQLLRNRSVRSGYVSAVVHLAALTGLALMFIEAGTRRLPTRLVIDLEHAAPDRGGLQPADHDDAAVEPLAIAAMELRDDHGEGSQDPAVVEADPPAVAAPATPPIERPRERPDRRAQAADPPGAALATRAAEAFDGRGVGGRAALVRARGGSGASELAVERGLAWLARHQRGDGSWRFDLSGCLCDGACRDPGSVTSTTAATGLALLPFLGAGNTPNEGGYRDQVQRGLYYLLSRLQPTARGGDLSEGTLYGHGVATVALAEALGMTRDPALVRPVADAVRFIATSQDLHGGGWRYLPGQAGDTTVTAWQLAALKSAALAGVAVPSPAIDGVRRFLDRVQSRGGEAYGYLESGARPCTSAIGLFCRLHTGWENRAAIERGLAALARGGPAAEAIYHNFYLSQALLQAEHPAWPRWNARNRDQLVARQSAVGHEAGSWYLPDRETAPGGRLAHTALAVLTLEVYYRILPLYSPDSLAVAW